MKLSLPLGAIGLVALNYMIGYHMFYAGGKEQGRLIRAQVTQEQANQQAQANVADLLRQIDQHRKRLPQEPSASSLAREVMARGKDAGLEIHTISQESPQPLKQFTRLSVDLKFTATYHQLGTFLDYLERSGTFIRVDHLEVENVKDPSAPSLVQLSLSTFYVPPVTLETKPAVPVRP